MRTVQGAGCWPGQAEGPVVWAGVERPVERSAVADRPAEVLRFRAELGRALADLGAWSEQQRTVEGRLLLQAYREALLEDAWHQRVCALIDSDGVGAPAAAVEIATQVAAVMGRSPALKERAAHLQSVAAWMAGRLQPPPPLPPDAILAANRFSPLAMIDRQHAAILGGPEPPLVGGGPLVWGIRELGPHWQGKRIAIDGRTVRLDVPDLKRWLLEDGKLNGLPLCQVDGNPEAVRRMAQVLGRRPAALIHRVDDLAAVPLLVGEAAAIALDLDRLGPAEHPGVRLLIDSAVRACKRAAVPLVVSGGPAERDPDFWTGLGCTALFEAARTRGGQATHAIRRGKESSL
jgi:hypothetical protein